MFKRNILAPSIICLATLATSILFSGAESEDQSIQQSTSQIDKESSQIINTYEAHHTFTGYVADQTPSAPPAEFNPDNTEHQKIVYYTTSTTQKTIPPATTTEPQEKTPLHKEKSEKKGNLLSRARRALSETSDKIKNNTKKVQKEAKLKQALERADYDQIIALFARRIRAQELTIESLKKYNLTHTEALFDTLTRRIYKQRSDALDVLDFHDEHQRNAIITAACKGDPKECIRACSPKIPTLEIIQAAGAKDPEGLISKIKKLSKTYTAVLSNAGFSEPEQATLKQCISSPIKNTPEYFSTIAQLCDNKLNVEVLEAAGAENPELLIKETQAHLQQTKTAQKYERLSQAAIYDGVECAGIITALESKNVEACVFALRDFPEDKVDRLMAAAGDRNADLFDFIDQVRARRRAYELAKKEEAAEKLIKQAQNVEDPQKRTDLVCAALEATDTIRDLSKQPNPVQKYDGFNQQKINDLTRSAQEIAATTQATQEKKTDEMGTTKLSIENLHQQTNHTHNPTNTIHKQQQDIQTRLQKHAATNQTMYAYATGGSTGLLVSYLIYLKLKYAADATWYQFFTDKKLAEKISSETSGYDVIICRILGLISLGSLSMNRIGSKISNSTPTQLISL